MIVPEPKTLEKCVFRIKCRISCFLHSVFVGMGYLAKTVRPRSWWVRNQLARNHYWIVLIVNLSTRIEGEPFSKLGGLGARVLTLAQENHKNRSFFNFLGNNSAQIARLELSRGLVMVTSYEESDFDSPRVQNPRKMRFSHKMSDFGVFA